ncbi:MAG: sensor histidine kinase [Devosiaceae bacterium]|nr:sensor histidine kinase [Devosiaceae bacterium MH13]
MARADVTHSLAFRLGLLGAGGSLVALAIAGVVMATLQRAGAERAFDERLAVFVTQLFADYANGRVADDTAHFANPAFEQPGSGWFWIIADPATNVPLLASRSVFDPLPASPRPASAQDGAMQTHRLPFGTQRLRLAERVFTLNDQSVLIRVTAPTVGLEREIERFRLALMATLGTMWFSLLVLAFLQIRIGLQPLKAVQDAVSDVREGRSQRVEGRFPSEVSPLIDELNALIASNAEIIERGRHHVGNLAHALKTPLAVILNASSDRREDPEASLSRIQTEARAIDDRVRLYLDRAQRAAVQSVAGQATQLTEVAEPLVRVMGKLNRDKDLAIEAAIDPSLRVRVERHDLEEALGNLLENACRHASGKVQLSAEAQADRTPMIRICIDDDGPGLTPDQRSIVLKRGERLDQAQPGSGLGLAIVQEIANLYAGTLNLSDSPLGGLKVCLTLPAAAAVTPKSSRKRPRRP